MKTEEFQILAGDLEKLTPHQRNVLADRLRENWAYPGGKYPG